MVNKSISMGTLKRNLYVFTIEATRDSHSKKSADNLRMIKVNQGVLMMRKDQDDRAAERKSHQNRRMGIAQ
jgi:hypothetical protein